MANLLEGLAARTGGEVFEDILARPGVRIERIVSTGQATPEGRWLEQAWEEWVLLLSGAAGLTLQGDPPLTLRPGDYLAIPAGRPHRVDWTSPEEPTVWLAVHIQPA